jgi:hypothetical protein
MMVVLKRGEEDDNPEPATITHVTPDYCIWTDPDNNLRVERWENVAICDARPDPAECIRCPGDPTLSRPVPAKSASKVKRWWERKGLELRVFNVQWTKELPKIYVSAMDMSDENTPIPVRTLAIVTADKELDGLIIAHRIRDNPDLLDVLSDKTITREERSGFMGDVIDLRYDRVPRRRAS